MLISVFFKKWQQPFTTDKTHIYFKNYGFWLVKNRRLSKNNTHSFIKLKKMQQSPSANDINRRHLQLCFRLAVAFLNKYEEKKLNLYPANFWSWNSHLLNTSVANIKMQPIIYYRSKHLVWYPASPTLFVYFEYTKRRWVPD